MQLHVFSAGVACEPQRAAAAAALNNAHFGLWDLVGWIVTRQPRVEDLATHVVGSRHAPRAPPATGYAVCHGDGVDLVKLEPRDKARDELDLAG